MRSTSTFKDALRTLRGEKRPVTASEVREVYRALLGREPESDAVAEAQASVSPSLEHLISNVANSPERLMGPARPRSEHDAVYDGLHGGDNDLMRRHLFVAESEAAYVKNFLGVRTRVSHVDVFAHLSGAVFNNIPTVVADYHAEPIEFVGTLKAIEAGEGPFVAVELGAGWGSWSITAAVAARRAGRTPIRLYAVEGSAGKVQNMHDHYRDNGFAPEDHTIVNAVVGATDGYALFPMCDVTGDWGAEAIFTNEDIEKEGYERLRMISLDTLLKTEALVDLIHCDVQGAEGDVITASADMLTEKVRYLVIGTHGRAIEGRIIEALLARGWEMENEQPAQICRSIDGKEALYTDGTQVWRNKAL